jgi:branched-chain amino acid transport system substrate-binding protein
MSRTRRSAHVLGASAVVAMLVLSACGSSEQADSSGATLIPLGATSEATGAAAGVGVHTKQGIELAVEKANADGGFEVGGKKYKWDLQLKDNQSRPDLAIANYKSFVGSDVNFILGPGISTAFPPAFNSLGSAHPLVVTPALVAAQFRGQPEGKNLFISHVDDSGANGRVAQFVSALQEKFAPKTVAVLLPQDDAGEKYTTLFTEQFESAGADVVYSKAFPSDTRDFASYITALKVAKPDLIVSGYLDSWLQPFVNQAAAAGLTAPVFVGAPGASVAALAQTEGAIKNFAWSVTTRAVDNAADPTVKTFREDFKAKYGEYPDANGFWALSYYDPVLMLTKALQDAGTVDDIDKIRSALLGVTSWPGQVMKGAFDKSSQQRVYGTQVGLSQNGKVTYSDAK